MTRWGSGRWLGLAVLSIVGVTTLVCGQQATTAPDDAIAFTPDEITRILDHSPLPPAPPDPTNAHADDPRAAHLGRFLFFETRLSGNGEVSCATCHDPAKGFSDGLRLTQGIERGDRHAQSLFNVAHNPWFLWDGRRDSLWAQAVEAIEREGEMGGHRLDVARLVVTDEDLRGAYEAIFGALGGPARRAGSLPDDANWDELTREEQRAVTRIIVNLAKAIAAYERQLTSADAPFDRFAEALRAGDAEGAHTHVSPQAQRGLRLFVGEANCAACHAGPNFTDGAFHNTLLPLDPTVDQRERDRGRFDGVPDLLASEFRADSAWTDAPDDERARRLGFLNRSPELWGAFKTPTLRSVALSPPYMHDGSIATLRGVVDHYADLNPAAAGAHHARDPLLQPLDLTDAERDDLVAFLESLTGAPLDAALFSAPEAPSGEASRGVSPR